MVSLSQIWVYPIKSMAGISLTQAQIDNKGILLDRQWMLVDENGLFLSQRKYTKMALFEVAIESNGLIVTYPQKQPLFIPFLEQADNHSPMIVRVWQDDVDAIVLSEQINHWFSEILNIKCRLVYMPETTKRLVDPAYAKRQQQTRFADGFPLLLVSEASLADLNNRLETPVTMSHFRPNMVVKNCLPYAEDSWKDFKINDIIFSVVKPCSRCVMTTIDPNTGEITGKEPLATLSQYRKQKAGVTFGQNVLFQLPQVVSDQQIKVNDEILL